MARTPASAAPEQSVALFDNRPFFEKALQHGVQLGLLDAGKLAAMRQEGPKGMVQIARYFGTEYLRPDLERARDRLVNLVSLYLEESSGGDLRRAAEDLREHSLLSRSKGGSEMLKALIAMPQNTHFGMQERAGFRDEHIPLLARWSLRSLPEVHAERARRTQAARTVDTALWMAAALDMEASALEDSDKDAEAVIRTALLAGTARVRTMPDWPAFEKMVLALRRQHGGKAGEPVVPPAMVLPKGMPAEHADIVKNLRASVQRDMPRILDRSVPVRKLFDQTPAFLGRYFWIEDSLAELDHFERSRSAVWDKATGGHAQDSALLTLFLRIATGSSPATVLTQATATSLVRKIRKSGLDAEVARQFVRSHAPEDQQADYLHLWDTFLQEGERILRSDAVHSLQDALALLRRECQVVGDRAR
jgi:hypothetical protein